MHKQGSLIWITRFLLLFPVTVHASFIESTLGTAVVNDATASYYNPAALILLKNAQLISLGSYASSRTRFTGTSIQSVTGFTQSGSATTKNRYFLPSLYSAVPVRDKVSFGLAIVSNSFNSNLEDNSILRYAQSGNSIQDLSFVPALGFRLNEFLSLGFGIELAQARFLSRPIFGFPALNIPDAQSRNESRASGAGGDIGFLLKPNRSTTIGFNYRSAITYKFSGTSVFEGNPELMSDNYSFTFWTPARATLSINHFLTTSAGLIATVQRIQWSIFNTVKIRGIATIAGILNANVPYHFRDTWLFTLGGHYRIKPEWVIRVAANYNQTPGNSNFQISTGDTITLGASMGYEITKNIIIDGSYAHAFVQNQTINIRTGRNFINGENRAVRDAVSLKLTINL